MGQRKNSAMRRLSSVFPTAVGPMSTKSVGRVAAIVWLGETAIRNFKAVEINFVGVVRFDTEIFREIPPDARKGTGSGIGIGNLQGGFAHRLHHFGRTVAGLFTAHAKRKHSIVEGVEHILQVAPRNSERRVSAIV